MYFLFALFVRGVFDVNLYDQVPSPTLSLHLCPSALPCRCRSLRFRL